MVMSPSRRAAGMPCAARPDATVAARMPAGILMFAPVLSPLFLPHAGSTGRPAGSVHLVEELDDAARERVFRPDHEQLLVQDELLEDLRAVPQVIHRGTDVRTHGLAHQRIG